MAKNLQPIQALLNHPKRKIEWFYLWGWIKGDLFFHLAYFLGKNLIHLSLHQQNASPDFFEYEGKDCRWEIGERMLVSTPHLNLFLSIESLPIVYINQPSQLYFSIPVLRQGDKVEAWFDYESKEELSDRDWVWSAIRVGKDVSMLYIGDTYIDYHMKAINLNTFTIKPVSRFKVFAEHSAGRPYSEEPFQLFRDGERVGVGMLEKTYLNKRSD